MVKEQKKKPHVHIIGAGMSGLATGLRLSELGIPVSIYEKSSGVGGMASSFAWGEFPYVDHGPHIFHTPDEQQAHIWESEYGDLFAKNEFWGKNVKGESFDELYDYPLSYDSLESFPKEKREKILAELSCLDESKKAEAKSYKEYVRELVGPTLMEMFFIEYPQKLWGITVDEMTANWAPKRVNFHREKGHFHMGQWSAVGKYGAGRVMERMAEKFVENGGELHPSSALTKIEATGTTIRGLVFGEKKVEVTQEDFVVSTMPLPRLAEMLGVSNKLTYRGAKLIFVALDKPQAIEGQPSFLYYDNPNIIFHRVSEQKKFSAFGFPPDKTLLTLEIAYTRGDERDVQPEQELIEIAIRDLNTVGLAKPGEVYDTKLVSLPYVYPMLAKGSEEELAHVRGAVAAYRQLFLIGTGGDYHYADLQILAVKGRDLADRIAGVGDEEGHVVRGSAYHEHFAKEVVLGTHTVTYGKSAFIIAEIGLNHNGSLELAKKLISAAKLSGASAAKLQSFSAGSRLSQKVKENRYAEELIDTEEGMFSMFKRLELTEAEHAELFAYAQSIDMVLFSTPFDIESLELLESFGAPFYKIASMDVVNLPLVRKVAETGKPIIMSTGMSSLAEIEDAVEVIQSTGNKNLILLQCVSSYPAVPQDMNLAAMKTLHKAFGVPVGFSDHTIGLTAATVALSLGATVIERHFTLDRFMEGPDHILSSEPHELTELVELSRLVPLIRGNGEKRVQGSKLETMNRFKKGLYAKVDIRTGDTITETMLTIKGPGGAILPKFQHDVVGKTARINIPADHPVKWDHFQ